jgi:hypothetical protein
VIEVLQQRRAVWALSDADVLDEFSQVTIVKRMAAARQLELIKAAETRGLHVAQGFSSVSSWLAHVLCVSRISAARLARLAKRLSDLPDVAKALADGQLSEDQAEVIAAAVCLLPEVSRLEGQRFLVANGADLPLHELEELGAGVHHHVDPEGADEAGLKKLEREEKRAQDNRSLTLTPLGEGIVRISGRTSAEGAAVIQSALDPLCNPARSIEDVLTATEEPLPLPLQDNRSAAQRRHDALIEVFQHVLACGDLPANGGDKAQLVVTMAYDALAGQISGATLDTGATITAEAARRIACDCGIVPAVLDGLGLPLDLGRERRLISGALRRALVLRDKGCTFPRCDRPPRWCHGHHAISWLDGGETSLGNSVLVCGYHHRLLHHSDWRVFIAADGLPTFLPPASLDPSQTARRNSFHRRT